MPPRESLSSRTSAWRLALVVWCVSLVAAASAQGPQQPRRGPRVDMQMVAESLGVDCDYCHAGRPVTASGRPRIDVARDMISMVEDLNAQVLAATGKSPAETARLDCATCHKGVPIPRTLRDLMLEATIRQGPDAAEALYRDLRAKYYGGQAYDFSEPSLLTVADRLAQSRPDAAIAIADLNIEFYPKSWRSYLARGIAQSRRLDTTPDAVESFRKALELDPGNGVIEGWLAQTEPVARRVR